MQPGSTDEAAFRGWVAKLLGEPEGLASEEYTVSHNSKYWRSTGGSVTRTAMCVSGTLPSHWSDARTCSSPSNLAGAYGQDEMNIVYVIYLDMTDAQVNVYRNNKKSIRNALQRKKCPYKALDAIHLPTYKYHAPNHDEVCNSNV